MESVPVTINLQQKLNQIAEQWTPKIIAGIDELEVKLAKLEGEFVWHRHVDADEAFFVIEGNLRIDFRDGSASLGPGEMIVVPKGVEHKPFAEQECHVMIIERGGTVNTGDAPTSRLTADPTAHLD